MKKILVTNDDGINTRGIAVLAEAMSSLGDVTVVAPDREMSGISHALTLAQPLRIADVRKGWHAISGTPTDCVYIGIARIMKGEVDLLVSGINNGANLSEDVHYSGTVAGAVEGSISGVPSIAFSQVLNGEADLDEAADFAARLAEAVLISGMNPRTYLNVNFPPHPAKGVKISRLGCRPYEKTVHEKVDPRGRRYYWIGGNEMQYEQEADADTKAIKDGYISVTPLKLDLTDNDAITNLADWELFRGRS